MRAAAWGVGPLFLTLVGACASPERDAILRVFDKSRNFALLDGAAQKAVLLHDLHPNFVALVGASASPPPFNVPIVSRDDFIARFLPAFNSAIKPFVKEVSTTVEKIAVRGNTAYVTTTTTATVESKRGRRREIKQRTHHFLVKVEGRGAPRWVILSEVPESADAHDKPRSEP